MAIESPARLPRPFLALLLSGGALLAAGLVGLWLALVDARERGADAERRARLATAQAITRHLREEALDAVPTEQRIAVRGGRVQLPEGLLWLDPPQEEPFGTAPFALAAKDLEARRAEYAGETERAGSLRRALLQDAELTARDRQKVLLDGAWSAFRQGDQDTAAARWEELETTEPTAGEGLPYRNVVAGALLLAERLDRSAPPWADLALMERSQVAAVIARLRVRGASSRAESLARAHAPIAAARDRLRRAQALLDDGRDAPALVDGHLWLADRDSVALLAGGVQEVAALGEAQLGIPPSGVPASGADGAEDATPVMPGLVLVPDPLTASGSGWSDQLSLFSLLTLLSGLFAVSLWATVRALRREQRALQTRAEFLTSVTHELKTPLASIRLLTERLDAGQVQSEKRRREYFALLAGESARLSVLVENVLDLGRMERGERSYDLQLQDPLAVLDEALTLFEPLARAEGMELERRGLDERGLHLALDRGALLQSLVNVLENALKYAKDGEAIEVAARLVEGDQAVGGLEITVRDFGPGVPIDERDRIFERFVRGARQSDGHVPGVGLGLHLARRIVQAHGGSLVCRPPAKGPGTCFVFRLPLQGTRSPEAVEVESS